MIPKFPQMKKLEISDKEDIEEITKKYPPYSDFNFISMWAWNIKDEILISELNDNLVVRFTDYITNEPFYSFLGNTEVNETAEVLMELSKKEGMKPVLKLIPEEVIKNINNTSFKITESEDHFDYIYSTEKLSKLLGSEYSNQRRLVNRFEKTNQNINIKNLNIEEEDRIHVLKLNNQWGENKKIDSDNDNQEEALMKLINNADSFHLDNLGVFIDTELISFTFNEKLHKQYALSHFAKFNIQHSGSYLHSMKVLAEQLHKDGFIYINCEQDLGIPGLRSSKRSLCPIFYLKKYNIEKNN